MTAPARELSFAAAEVERFAAASGDVNPLHVDPAFARSTPFGGCIVHGSLLALGMVGTLPAATLRETRSLRVVFSAPLGVGAPGRVAAEESGPAWHVRLTARGKLLARLTASRDAEPAAEEERSLPEARPARTVPWEPELEELEPGRALVVDYAPDDRLGALANELGAGELPSAFAAGLAWASYVVGMEVPGLHGLLAAISLRMLDRRGAAARGTVVVRGTDVRSGRIVLAGSLDAGRAGAVATEIECFARPAPARPDAALLRDDGAGGARDRGAAVVVGASRGFGAAATLALLGRGYAVDGVYATSTYAAEELRALAGDHAPRLALHRTDAADPAAVEVLADTLKDRGQPLRGLLLAAAPPPLPMGVTAGSAAELTAYVEYSLRLAATPLGALLPLLDPDAWVVFCSSAAVAAPPRDWPHYAAAKGALEGLASWLAASSPRLRSIVLRLPKLATDMTNTPAGRIGAAPVEPFALRLGEVVDATDGARGLVLLEPAAGEAATA